MMNRPTVGAVGVVISALAPDGEADFEGAVFQVRAEGGRIDSGRYVLVTGFDPWSLTVREARSEEVAAHRSAAPTEPAHSENKGVLWGVGVVVFGSVLVLGSMWSFEVGGLAGSRRSGRLLIPFFLWYFAWQRWDIAKWAFLVNVLGLVVNQLSLLAAG